MGDKKHFDRQEFTAIICERISLGESLTQICKDEGMPNHSTFISWVREDDEIANEYARARESRADVRADRIDTYVQQMLAKEIDPQQCRVAIDAEKWQAGKELPKRYGDRLELAGDVGLRNATEEQIDAKLAALLAKAQTSYGTE